MKRFWSVLAVAGVLLAIGATALSREAPSPPQPPIWAEGFEGDRGAWNELQACCPHSFRATDQEPDGRGRAGRFEVRAEDALEDGSRRAQLSGPRLPAQGEIRFTEGMERWFGWRMKLDRSYPTDPEHWTVLVAWKEDGGGQGPLKLSTSFEEGSFRLEGPGGDTVSWRAPIVRDAWLGFVVRIRFSPDPQVGYVEVWHQRPGDERPIPQTLTNGQKRMRVSTMEPGNPESYLKLGVYRDPEFPTTSVAWFDDVHIGRSFRAVAP